jgi:uncharacterized protein YihD (DUF1040 family)
MQMVELTHVGSDKILETKVGLELPKYNIDRELELIQIFCQLTTESNFKGVMIW